MKKDGRFYQAVYRFRSVQPKEVGFFVFLWDLFSAGLFWALYWLIVGTGCVLFAWKPKGTENKNNLFWVPIAQWPKFIGQRIYPVSLLVPVFMLWPFFSLPDKQSPIGIAVFFSYIVFISWIIYRIGESNVWKRISEKTKIVFVENGG